MKIQDFNINKNSTPFFVAEISGNHAGSFDRASEILEKIAQSGAQAIKFQTFSPDRMTLDINHGDFVINDKKSIWYGKNLYQLYKEAMTPRSWFKPLFQKAKKLGLIAFSSPFDETAVDFLEELKVPLYKIASYEIVHLPLIKKVAKTGKPLIFSTGMATLDEIGEAVEVAKDNGCKEFAILKCSSIYPADAKESNLLTINELRKKFNCEVGFSDHTLGIGASIAAVINGASIIEKHVTLKRNDKGVDSSFSLEPHEFKKLIEEAKIAKQSLGKIKFGPTKSELTSLIYRRSIYASSDIKKGQLISEKNIDIIRPSYGLHPRHYKEIIGKKAAKDIKRGTPMKFEYINKND